MGSSQSFIHQVRILSPRRLCGVARNPRSGHVAILYSSSQNSLTMVPFVSDVSGSAVAILYSSSQNSLTKAMSSVEKMNPLKVAILYSSSQNSLMCSERKRGQSSIARGRNPLFIKSEFSPRAKTEQYGLGM